MKKGFQCPSCGNLEAVKLLISTLKGKTLNLLVASQAVIHKSKHILCSTCHHIGFVHDFRRKRP